MINNKIFDNFPQIDLEELVLRQLEDTDALAYQHYINQPEMLDFFTDENLPKNQAEARSEINYWRNLFLKEYSIYWAIALKKNNQLIGTAGFNIILPKDNIADLSYDLDVNFWGRGVMSRVIEQIIIFADQKLLLTKIRATCAVNNLRSIKLLEKYNFKQEKLLKKYEIIRGQSRDYFLYTRKI